MRSEGLLLLALAGCSDYSLFEDDGRNIGSQPIIEVEPPLIDFLSASETDRLTKTFAIRNIGNAPLYVSELTSPASADFRVVWDGAQIHLEESESQDVEVTFQPTQSPEQTDQILVRSDDPEHPEIPVTVRGSGRLPWLQIDPPSWDFGTPGLGCPDDVKLTLQNVGAETLTLSDLAMSGDPSFSLVDWPPLPVELGPSAYTTVTVRSAADAIGTWNGALEVTSNDPRGVVSASFAATPSDGVPRQDRFSVAANPPVDIVFAVDQSASMDDDAAALGSSFGAFIETIEMETSAWRLGVVTYDSGCFNEGMLTSSSASLGDRFASAVAAGTDGEITDDERLLQLASRALANTAAGRCNEGFLRSDALLHVIIVSDEPERSEEEATAWTWDYWVDDFLGYKTTPALVEVSGVVDVSGCGEGDAGYDEAIAATGGLALSICSADWASYAAALAKASTGGLWRFVLSDTAVAATITVSVDGVPLASGWRYDTATNAVIVDSHPESGEVTIDYRVATECP